MLRLSLPLRFEPLPATTTTSSSLAALRLSWSSSSTINPLALIPNFFKPSLGVSTCRICLRLVRLLSALGIVASKPRKRLTFDATPSSSGTSASNNSSVASTICNSREVTRCEEPRPSRSGARPRVAKSIFELDPLTDARGREDTVAAELIIRGVIITGATISRHELLGNSAHEEYDAIKSTNDLTKCELNLLSCGERGREKSSGEPLVCSVRLKWRAGDPVSSLPLTHYSSLQTQSPLLSVVERRGSRRGQRLTVEVLQRIAGG